MLGVLFLLAGANETRPGQKDDATPTYFPLQAGNLWRFRIEEGGRVAVATTTIARIETIDGVQLARLEASSDGKVRAVEHLRQTEQGVFRYREDEKAISPPVCLLQYPVKAGAKWNGEITVNTPQGKKTGKYFCETKDEAVTVPAGKFQAIRVVFRHESVHDGLKRVITTTYWFVNDVGIVRQTVEAGDLKINMELEKFDRAKEKNK
jgi:hypothetical protein